MSKGRSTIKPKLLDINSIRPAISELERAVQWAYGRATGDASDGLGKVTVLVQSRGRRARCGGHFEANSWRTTGTDKTGHEISICSEVLTLPIHELLGIVVHETVHLWAEDCGIKDTSTTGRRHNKKFKALAEDFGLVVAEPSDSYGHGYTQPGETLIEAIESELKPDLEAFRSFHDKQQVKKPARVTEIPWACDCTTVRVPVKTILEATCLKCETDFRVRDTGGAEGEEEKE